MAGTLSSLGIGSDGALSYSVIDQLKDADTASVIKPIEQKIELNQKKHEKLNELKSLVSDVNNSVVTMSDPEIYQSKEVTLSGSSVEAKASAKAKPGLYALNVTQLATSDIKQSNTGYGYEDALMGEGTMHLEIDGNTYDINVLSTDSIKSVTQKINEQTEGKIEASLLNVGGDDPYHIVLKSADTGAKNNISVTGDYNFDQVGSGAKDATFTYNDIQITRPDNEIDDLIDGLDLTLKQTGSTSVTITQDNSKLIEGMEKFVDSYNKMIQSFTESTKFDKTSKEAGIFQGNSSIRSAANMIKDALILTTSKAGKTINSFGLELQRDGTIELNKNSLEKRLKENPKEVENFFRGTDGRNGLFNKLETTFFDIKTSSNGILKSLGKNLDDDATRLQTLQKTAQKRLDDRYSIMAKKFAAFDSVIARLNSQGDTMKAMIDAELAQKQ